MLLWLFRSLPRPSGDSVQVPEESTLWICTGLPDVRLSGNTTLVDELDSSLSEYGIHADRHYAHHPMTIHAGRYYAYYPEYQYIIIEILKFGTEVGTFVLFLLLRELTKRWLERPRETMLLIEYNDPPVKWNMQGHPSKVKEDIERLLGWQFSCPYCGLRISFGKFCNKCGRRLL